MAAAFEVLMATPPAPNGRRVAILGDMLELGAAADRLHMALAEDANLAQVDVVHCVGAHMAHLHKALPAARAGQAFGSAAKVNKALPSLLQTGDVVLVKGSLGARMVDVVQAVRGRCGR